MLPIQNSGKKRSILSKILLHIGIFLYRRDITEEKLTKNKLGFIWVFLLKQGIQLRYHPRPPDEVCYGWTNE